MIKQFFKFTLISISISSVGAQEEQEVKEVQLPADHTASHALHGIIDNNLPSDVVQLIGKFMGDYPKINIIDTADFITRVMRFNGPRINSVSLTSDGKFLASAPDDQTVKIWNSDTGKCITTLKGHDEKINSVHWSEGKLLASASDDQTVKIWAPFLGSCLLTLVGHTQGVNEVKWSPQGTQLASCANDSAVRVWDAESGNCLQVLDHEGEVRSVSWLSDNELITTCNNKIVKWNPNTAQCLAVFENPDGIVYTAQGSPVENVIAFPTSKGDLFLGDNKAVHKLYSPLPEATPIHWLSRDVLIICHDSSEDDREVTEALTERRISFPYLPVNLLPFRKLRLVDTKSKKTIDLLGGSWAVQMDHADRSRPTSENGNFTSIDSSRAGRIAAGCTKGKISIWDPSSKYLVELCTSKMREQLRTPVAIKVRKTIQEECIIQ